MRVVIAPEKYVPEENDITCFLAGGITGCKDWQKGVLDLLRNEPESATEHLVIFNPRRENFPIYEPGASTEQVKWEFDMLERCDIFSMFFAASDSEQPICMYELGRNLVRMNEKFPGQTRSIVSIEGEGLEKYYKRAHDVILQTCFSHVLCILNTGGIKCDISDHEHSILRVYREILYNVV